jgi:DNA (cytosine-5)-methyltransferase 1
MRKPKILDLFCCQGGAGVGYSLAGFDVVGVDINPQPKYPFSFFQSDALSFDLSGFDAVHASPPCQRYSNLTPEQSKKNHPDLISSVREKLVASGLPYIIENVAGAKRELLDPVMLCGSMFGLRTRRHRFFECSFAVVAPCVCDHSIMPLLVTTASKASRSLRHSLGIKPKSVQNAVQAYGINWMNFSGLKEAIPPAYTEYLGKQLRAHVLCAERLPDTKEARLTAYNTPMAGGVPPQICEAQTSP